MAGTRYDHGGGAVGTTLNADITSGDTSLVIDDATGWPSGGAAGNFWIAVGNIDPVSQQFTSNVEKIKVGSRTGTTLSSLTRGADGTTATAHVAGETVRHIFASDEAHQASEHAGDTTRHDHTQYLRTSDHAAISHTKAMMAADSVGTSQIEANAVTASELADNAVDTAAIADLAVSTAKIADSAVTAAKIADGTVTATEIADGTITATEIANDTITATQIAADAIGSAELANNAVDTAAIADDAVTAAKIADGAIDAAPKVVDAIITFAKLASEASTDYSASVTFTNPTGNFVPGTGTNVKYANYYKFGRIVLYWVHFTLGTGGNITAGGTIEVNLPHAATASHRAFGAAKARQAGGTAYSGTAAIGAGASIITNFVTAGASASWDATTPFNWDAGDSFDAVIIYEAAA